MSLSARRAWIEIISYCKEYTLSIVALRKESVDRNHKLNINNPTETMSLSARRAWIEIAVAAKSVVTPVCRSPQGERG